MEEKDIIELHKKESELSEEEKILRNAYLKDISDGRLFGPQVGIPSLDKNWLKYYDFSVESLKQPNMSMIQYAIECNKNRLDSEALDLRMSSNDFKKSIKKISYEEYFDNIVTIACGFLAYDVKINEVMLQVLPNLIESRESVYACNAMGATAYTITPMLPETVVDNIIKKNDIRNVIVYNGFYKKYEEQLNNSNIDHIFCLNGLEQLPKIFQNYMMMKDKITKANKFQFPENQKIVEWNDLIDAGKKYRKENKINNFNDFDFYYSKEHIAAIVGTSGTTGIPKGVCLSDNSFNAVAVAQMSGGNFTAGEANLDALLQSIAYGLSVMHYSTCGGLKNYLIPELITDKFPKVLSQLNPDHFAGGPVHYENLSKSDEFKNGEIKQARNLISGGASLSKETESRLNGGVGEGYVEPMNGETPVYVRQGLGLSENLGVGTYAKKGSYKFGGQGIPILLETVGIFDPETGKELGTNIDGELCITGPTIMSYYYNNEDETKKVLKVHEDGQVWLHTGDIGHLDKDGQLFMVDRIKNIFMRTGFNVHPSKITDFINGIQFVDKSVTIGVNHPTESCVPVSFVKLSPEYNGTKDDAINFIQELCFKNLEETSIPYEIRIVDELPVNLGGKIDVKKLLEESGIDYMNDKNIKQNRINVK